MPEGVEVTIIREKLATRLQRCKLDKVKILGGRYSRHGPPTGFSAFNKALPLRIKDVCNYGKFVYIVLDKDWTILITLGMSGIISVHNKPNKHDNILFQANCLNFYFNDMRNFGTVAFFHGKKELDAKLDSLGPDPLKRKVSYNRFIALLNKCNPDHYIADILLDQTFFSGVGNYLRADILYCAKIFPETPVSDLTNRQKRRLYECIYKIPRRSYDILSKELKTISNTETGDELKSGNKFLVYKQKRDPLGNPVVRKKMKNGRSIWYSPKIQYPHVDGGSVKSTWQ
jgi:formamidopyrimidine-DNA glycosylase